MPRPKRVFDAWLEREQWQAWIGPEGCQCEVPLLEPKVGGRYRILMHCPTAGEIPVEGVFKVIDRPNAPGLHLGLGLERQADTLVTLTFRAKGSKTEITSPMKACPRRKTARVTARAGIHAQQACQEAIG